MNLTNLAGEKADVKIQHASIAAGNLSLTTENKHNGPKVILGKKKNRSDQQNKNPNANGHSDKKPEETSAKADKSIF